MPYLSTRSRDRLLTCEAPLILLCTEAIKIVDFSVTCGHRSNEEQAERYAQGRSAPGKIVTWAKPGESRHNSMPSTAVDLAPWVPHIGIPWDDEQKFIELGGAIMFLASQLNIPLEWGGHWRHNDFPHYQLARG